MALFLIFLGFCYVNAILCLNSDSSPEMNRIEYSPLYETIIYSDIADIIKDFENNMNSPLEAFVNTDDSGSDEKIEDLLSEYQHYLDKAHKQRKNYLEKTKSKNKTPLLQRDRYSKSNPSQAPKHDDYYTGSINYYNPDTMQYPQSPFKTPLDFLIPINMMKSRFYDNYQRAGPISKDNSVKKPLFEKADGKVLQLPPAFPSAIREPMQSSCYCESDTLPCECGCKQCLIPLEPTQRKNSDFEKLVPSSMFKQSSIDNSMRSMGDNSLNIKIKVDLQFPKIQDSNNEMVKNTSNDKIVEHGSISRESNINLPFPYFNFPIPLEMYGFKRSDQESQPIHKITIHRKKKSKTSNGKRHRKKVITFHNIKLDPQNSGLPSFDENYNMSDYRQNIDSNYQINQENTTNNFTQKIELNKSNITTNKTTALTSLNDSKTDDSIYLMVNIRNNADNFTDDAHRNENSIEADYTRRFSNTSTEEPLLRQKRDVSRQNNYNIDAKKSEIRSVSHGSNLTVHANNSIKKTDKILFDDTELLYWSNNSKGISPLNSKNITMLILDTETKKVKLNLSTEAIRHNRTTALEKAIFGVVDWDNVGTVAPVFMSFMGKYIRGVLTFCSESICHSMKCADKTCIHRTCTPDARINNKGHCNGSGTTDSVASMEAIMDLPSNIALEIVEILQAKMLGKLYGKVTLCIGSKCVTFVASKKLFLKSKCTTKDLNSTGHCPNIKT